MNVDENDPMRTHLIRQIQEVLEQDDKDIEQVGEVIREAERKAEELNKPST